MSEDIRDHLTQIYGSVAELQRRIDSMIVRGPVHSVDPEAGTARLRLGGTDEKPFLSAPIPYAQAAGALKFHNPPSVGQQMAVLSPTGDFRQGIAMPMTWSDDNKSPSKKGDEHVMTFGSMTVTIKGKALTLQIGGLTVNLTDEKATISIGGTSFEVSGSGIAATAADYDWKH